MPDLVTLKASEGYVFGKVSLNFAANAKGTGVIAPYSLVANQSAMVATPLLWEEVDQGLRAETFSFKSIADRLHDAGDPFERFSKTKTDADDLLSMLDDDYSFLL